MSDSTHTFTYNHPVATHTSGTDKNPQRRNRQFTIESIGVYPLNPKRTRMAKGVQYEIPHNYVATTNEFNRKIRVSINYADDYGNLPILYKIEWQENNVENEVVSVESLTDAAVQLCKV